MYNVSLSTKLFAALSVLGTYIINYFYLFLMRAIKLGGSFNKIFLFVFSGNI